MDFTRDLDPLSAIARSSLLMTKMREWNFPFSSNIFLISSRYSTSVGIRYLE